MRNPRQSAFALIFVAWAILPAVAQADSAIPSDFAAKWSEVPSVIVGTLKPFALAVDGIPIEVSASSVEFLQVNGEAVTGSSESAFSLEVDEDEIEIRFRPSHAPTGEVVKAVRLPKLLGVEVESANDGSLRARIRFDSADRVQVDGAEIQNDVFELPASVGSYDRNHVVELQSGDVVRTYNLRIWERGPAFQLIAAIGGDRETGSHFLSAGAALGFRSGLALSLFLETTGEGEINTTTWRLNGGWRLFRRPRDRGYSPWLEPGIFTRLGNTRVTEVEGAGSTRTISYREWFVHAGVYLRSELIRLGPIGLGARGDFRPIRIWIDHPRERITPSSADSRVFFQLELSFHF